MQRAQLLRQLVLDSQYVIDEHLVATAMLARAAVRRAVGGVTFRNDEPRSPHAVASRPACEGRTTSVKLGLV
ncbi:MAG: hypothetical protein JWM66_1274 [Solirubrobacterales bacterium]|jgi:hypothetical protein|nr:hypothetical protein [Solirubrobacterales bacterium]